MFDWKERLRFLQDNPRFNNAVNYGVRIVPKQNSNWVASIYHLSPNENRGGHTIYIRVLCKQNEIDAQRAINWGWLGMNTREIEQTTPIYDDKGPQEIKTHPIFKSQQIWLSVAGGDSIEDIHTGIDPDVPADDGGHGNSRFHHSYMVLFQEVNNDVPPTPDPDPDPDPEISRMIIWAKKDWIDSLPVQADGSIKIVING